MRLIYRAWANPFSTTQGDPIEVTIKADGALSLRDGATSSRDKFTRTSLVSRVVDMQKGKERPVVIAADKSVKYDEVVGLLSALHAQGVKRVGLVAKQGG